MARWWLAAGWGCSAHVASLAGPVDALGPRDAVRLSFVADDRPPPPGSADVVVPLMGGPPRGDARSWRNYVAAWAAQPVWLPAGPTAGDGERRRWREAAGLPDDAPVWRSLDAVVSGRRWRFVAVDAAAKGADALEQRYGLPRVLAGDDYDELVIISQFALSGPTASPDALALAEAIWSRVPPARLAAVVTLGPAPGVYLPDGPWGEVTVVAATCGSAVDLRTRPAPLDGWVRTLAAAAEMEVNDLTALPAEAACGSWHLDIIGGAGSLRWEGAAEYQLRFTPDRGWVSTGG